MSMRFGVLVMALVGCGRLDFGSHPGDAAPTGDAPPASRIVMSETFSAATIPPAWSGWRTAWQVSNGQLVSLPQARPGFAYGHFDNGRGPAAIAGLAPPSNPPANAPRIFVGDPTWTDYRLELDVQSLGMDPAFNPFALPTDCRGFSIGFRQQDAAESWNDPYSSGYGFSLQTSNSAGCSTLGAWGLGRSHETWISNGAGSPGYGYCNFGTNTCEGHSYALANGTTTAAIDGMNHIAIEIAGTHVTVSVNGTQVVDYVDNTVGYMTPDTPLTFGGISITGIWESMLAIDNVTVTTL